MSNTNKSFGRVEKRGDSLSISTLHALGYVEAVAIRITGVGLSAAIRMIK